MTYVGDHRRPPPPPPRAGIREPPAGDRNCKLPTVIRPAPRCRRLSADCAKYPSSRARRYSATPGRLALAWCAGVAERGNRATNIASNASGCRLPPSCLGALPVGSHFAVPKPGRSPPLTRVLTENSADADKRLRSRRPPPTRGERSRKARLVVGGCAGELRLGHRWPCHRIISHPPSNRLSPCLERGVPGRKRPHGILKTRFTQPRFDGVLFRRAGRTPQDWGPPRLSHPAPEGSLRAAMSSSLVDVRPGQLLLAALLCPPVCQPWRYLPWPAFQREVLGPRQLLSTW